MSFHIDDSEVADRLRSIREAVGARRAKYEPNRFEVVDVVVPGNEVEALFSSSGLLVRDGRYPVFAYIRDHTHRTLLEWGEPKHMKKLHFSVCETLNEMKAQGRFERYRVTNTTGNKHAIDVKGDAVSQRSVVEEHVPLLPCKNCLRRMDYRSYRNASREEQEGIVHGFNAQEALDLMWQRFDLFQKDKGVAGLQSAHSPTGYTDNWKETSRAFKKRMGWQCGSCGVRLPETPHLLDTHHKNGDKRDNSDDNLECLCKECHSKEHPHYHVSEEDLRTIEQARLWGYVDDDD